MSKLTKAQQEIIDVLKGGGKLELLHVVRGEEIWKLGYKHSGIGKPISRSTLAKLESMGLIVHKNNYPKWPLNNWYELTKQEATDGD